MKAILPTIFIITFAFNTIHAQEDSLLIKDYQKTIESDSHDTLKVKALWNWDNIVYFSDPKMDSSLLNQIVEICKVNLDKEISFQEKRFFAQNLAQGLNYLGAACQGLGWYADAVDKHLEAIPIYQQLNQINGLDGNYINLGVSSYYNGDIKGSIKYYHLGIKTAEKSGNLQYKANGLANLANVYSDQGDYEKAMSYFYQAIAIEDRSAGAQEVSYLNLGNVYLNIGNLDSAQICYFIAKDLGYEIEDYYTLGTTLNNLGEVYLKKNQMDSSFYYYTEGMRLRKELNLQRDLIYSYAGLSTWYITNNNGPKGVEYGEKGLQLASTMNSYVDLLPAVESLLAAYEYTKNYKRAYEVNKLLVEVNDSIKNIDNQKTLISKELEYEYEKNKLADSLAFEKQKIMDDLAHQNELDQEANQRYFLYCGLGFVLILGGLSYRGYRRKRADNLIISEQKEHAELQKEIIEEAHQEITDSIAYAKRIQSAILPPPSMVKEYLGESFILYKPKDVVAGDFYWLEKVNNQVLFAAADCTGHGVPGAMVSVICNGALNRSVREFKLTDPGKILDQAREIVIQEFEKSEEEVKDGMDIALCCLEGYQLSYAGANNPLWIVRNGEVLETKANKQPIGKFDAAKPFSTTKVDLIKGDTIYLFSDGYVDQFGGDKGKKFKAKALRELLISLQGDDMKEQANKLEKSFETWKGDLEQIDDVCIIGVRIE